LFDVKTHEVSKLPGSEGLFSPRWSPDGRYIMALPSNFDDHRTLLFDLNAQRWRELCKFPAWGYPSWSRDSNYIYGRCGLQ
jgi:Tol biopolymer transport system component